MTFFSISKAVGATAARSNRSRPVCCTRQLRTRRPDVVIVPVAIAYDLVLEDFLLAKQRVKRRQRPFAREVAEMVRYAVGISKPRLRQFRSTDQPWRLRPERSPRHGAADALDSRDDRSALQSRSNSTGCGRDAAIDQTPANSRVVLTDWLTSSRRRTLTSMLRQVGQPPRQPPIRW